MSTLSVSPPVRPLIRIRPTRGWASLRLADIWHYRDLLLALAARDVKLRYRQTALGAAWVLIQPLISAAIFAFVFGTVARLDAPAGVSYFTFCYAGMLAYNLFSITLTKSSSCLIQNAPLVSKVFFPRVVLPLSTTFGSLLDFAVGLGLMAVMLLMQGPFPGFRLVLLPLWLALMLSMALGIGLFTAALTVWYRDVQYILPFVVQLILYASPVAYSIANVPKRWHLLFSLNPLASLLECFRWSLLGIGSPPWLNVAYAAAASAAMGLGGLVMFKRMERRFADVI